jgi:hypothetical protein
MALRMYGASAPARICCQACQQLEFLGRQP